MPKTSSTRFKLLTFALVPLLAACAMSDIRAPAFIYGQSGGADSAGFHTVSSGENLYKLSLRYGLAMPDIITANNLQPPYALASGQRLKLPPPRVYAVKPGDTLYNVAHAFGVSESDLARQNNLREPYRLTEGTTLRLPSSPGETRMASADSFILPPPSTDNVMPPPRLAPAGAIDREVLANPQQTRPQQAAPQRQAEYRFAGSASSSLTPPVPALSSATGFIWPVQGRVASAFGSTADGIHNDGINILAARGAPVRAARDGTIVYAGRRLRGYGNMILIRHDSGWVTTYAHMQKLLVRKGQRITQGDAIGTVGATGSVDTEQLHFEIRRGTEALDPLQYLNRRTI